MKHLFLLVLCLPFWAFAQSSLNLGRTDDDQLQKNLNIEVDQLRSYIYNDIPESYKGSIRERKMYRFADQSAFISSNILLSGSVYNGWRQADLYLNAVLQKVLPENLKDKPYLKVYLLKESSYNAFMTPSGQLFINIGIFDEIENESSLAGIIAHEVAHYVLRHSVEGFIKSERGEFKAGFLFRNEGAASRFSVENELQADSLACNYMQNAGYNAKGLIDAFEVFSRIEENALLRQKYTWETEETTHPRSEKRLTRIEELANDNDQSGANFIISEGAFKRIKENAKAEVLKYLLDDFDYYTCLEKAFKYHLFDPYNPTYIYYLMEAIRRSCYLNPELWNEKFYVHRYYDIVEKGGERKKVEMETHLFDSYRPKLLGLAADSYEAIEAKFYWEEEAKFISNSEAFDFFFQISKLLNEPECTLTFALGYSGVEDEEKRNEFLRQYLKNEEILHREYAQSLLDGNITKELRNHKLTVFNKFITIIRQGKHEVIIWKEPEELDQNGLLDTIEAAVSAFPDRMFMNLSELKTNRLNDYLALTELERFSSSFLITKNENTTLHILDPAYWELLKKFQINEIEFLNCIYRDVVKSDGSVEGYQKVANSNHHDYLQLEKRVGRHFNIFLTSVKIKEEENMKMRYYDGEDRLGAKPTGYQHVYEFLLEKLKSVDEYNKDE